MYKSPSTLSESARGTVAASLNDRLLDGLDLHGQIKVAHWNIKGPMFASLHPLFEQFAIGLAAFNDTIAERAVTLGLQVKGTARQVAASSRIPEYPVSAVRDMDHMAHLADRFEQYLEGVRETRRVAEQNGDTDSVDLMTQVVTEFEKNAWFLRASLER
ncbi:MAG: DNA starvation/stationary phase protection protein Dps [Candidatus Eisenbacteria bacterium]|nr:DNA starvation/stationary phase protection protein Dps [Candidatus Eisenbacteria bacterium]MCC7141459.1 DNA starvation/stationary phase protection protein Dps [Candidatus Eisenbacteria bacterium]